MKLHEFDHSRKTVHLGIDVHKGTYSICAVAEHLPRPIKIGNIPAVPETLFKSSPKCWESWESWRYFNSCRCANLISSSLCGDLVQHSQVIFRFVVKCSSGECHSKPLNAIFALVSISVHRTTRTLLISRLTVRSRLSEHVTSE